MEGALFARTLDQTEGNDLPLIRRLEAVQDTIVELFKRVDSKPNSFRKCSGSSTVISRLVPVGDLAVHYAAQVPYTRSTLNVTGVPETYTIVAGCIYFFAINALWHLPILRDLISGFKVCRGYVEAFIQD